jgi:hypothetical protein
VIDPLSALVTGQGLWLGERDDHHPDAELVNVVQHLDQVLAAGQSGKVAQEDDQRLLARER